MLSVYIDSDGVEVVLCTLVSESVQWCMAVSACALCTILMGSREMSAYVYI